MKTLLVIEVIIIVLLLSACGRGTVPPSSIDPAFQAYADAFDKAAEAQGSSARSLGVTIQFGDLSNTPDPSVPGDTEGAVCNHVDEAMNISPIITVDRAGWEGMVQGNRQDLMTQMIFHELGHCVLHRQHLNTTMHVGINGQGICPASIMNASFTDPMNWCMDQFREHYMEELFGN
jgi:hypothetical protein